MKVDECLKLLAEKEPEKFVYEEHGSRYHTFGLILPPPNENTLHRVVFINRHLDAKGLIVRITTTQDAIDSILAEIGKRYTLEWLGDRLIANIYELNWQHLRTIDTFEKEKLPASKVVLADVVEKEYGGKR